MAVRLRASHWLNYMAFRLRASHWLNYMAVPLRASHWLNYMAVPLRASHWLNYMDGRLPFIKCGHAILLIHKISYFQIMKMFRFSSRWMTNKRLIKYRHNNCILIL